MSRNPFTAPPARREHWTDDAACRGHDWRAFFTKVRQNQDRLVATFCAACPVTEQCLDMILSTERPTARVGVFGGMTARARERMQRHRATH